jgi:hypothetical protein
VQALDRGLPVAVDHLEENPEGAGGAVRPAWQCAVLSDNAIRLLSTLASYTR